MWGKLAEGDMYVTCFGKAYYSLSSVKKKNLQGCGKSQTALVCQGCCNKEAAGLLKQKFILSQCWKLEV